ncbi:MAG: permease-like cell division protein FtsX [Clostridiales Family XIII bacterium]|jgi:cell division transport system permease protein|nr:permease-like cell division protein FtsX [Clostridiales Family XIII bacterium]
MIYSIKQAAKQFARNRAMSMASVFSITAILLVLGLFFILVVNINNIAESAKQDFNVIRLYLLDSTDYGMAEDIMGKFSIMPEVRQVSYLSEEKAMEDFRVKFGDKAYILDTLRENPLPNSVIVEVSRLEDAGRVAAKARAMEGVEDISYYKETVDRLLKVTNFIQIGAMAVILALVIISVVVVSNTIKLTVLAREREISIMKYVGATNWFIRGPFLGEGIFIGIVSAGVSAGLIALVYHKLVDVVGPNLLIILSAGMVPERFLISNLAIVFIALGVSIGACGSIVSMRRFLDT